MVRFIFGLPGSGKTTRILKEIMENNENAIIICPEQYSLAYERRLLEVMGISGLGGAEVLSLRRLAHRILGGRSTNQLSETGKIAVISKILSKNARKLKVFNASYKQVGFIQEMIRLISEFKRYTVNSEVFEQLDLECLPSLLADKLDDIALVYKEYEEYLSLGFLDGDDIPSRLADIAHDCDVFRDATIYFDQYKDFTPSELKFVAELMLVASKVTFSFASLPDMFDIPAFRPISSTTQHISRLAECAGIDVLPPLILGVTHKFSSRELRHICENYFSLDTPCVQSSPDCLGVIQAGSELEEVEIIARKIFNSVFSGECRFCDCFVLARNVERYSIHLENIFAAANIPYFISDKIPLTSHALASFVLSSVEAAANNCDHQSMLNYLKSGYSTVPQDEVDVIENYCIAVGRLDWRTSWETGDSIRVFKGGALNVPVNINVIREKCVGPINKMHAAFKVGRTIREKCASIYKFMKELHVDSKVVAEINSSLNTDKELETINTLTHVYNAIIETLDEVVDAVGDQNISITDFAQLISTTFGNVSITLPPPALDSVTVLSVERANGLSAKHCYILGANDGIFPADVPVEGMLSDDDRKVVATHSVALAAATSERYIEEQLLAYIALAVPSHKLILTFATTELSGKSLSPSSVILRLREMFADLLPECSSADDIVTTPALTLTRILKAERDMIWLPVLQASRHWFLNGEFAEIYNRIHQFASSCNSTVVLGREVALQLYGSNTSVSKLEAYGKCPFMYFLKYGLSARKRKVAEFSTVDIGVILHHAIEEFSSKMLREGKEWAAIDVQYISENMAEYMSNISAHDQSLRFKQQVKRLERIAIRSLTVIREHIVRGDFRPIAFEHTFERQLDIVTPDNIQGTLDVMGKIDRLDSFRDDGIEYLRIIDYKSGNAEFEPSSIVHRLNMQLPAYLSALSQESGRIPVAFLYMKLDDPIIEVKRTVTDEELRNLTLSSLKMQGVIVNQSDILRMMDHNFDSSSAFLPIKMTKNGLDPTSSVATFEQLEALRRYTTSVITDTFCETIGGNIEIRPYRKGTITPCMFCEYSRVCKTDGKTVRELRDLSVTESWEYIENFGAEEVRKQ